MLHLHSKKDHSFANPFFLKALGLVPNALGLVPNALEPLLFNLLLLISILLFQ